MSAALTRAFDWHPDLADIRDYRLDQPRVSAAYGSKHLSPKLTQLPDEVDWREYCGPVEDEGDLPTSTVHACVAMVQQFERRASGRLLRLSRLFLHWTGSLAAGVASGGRQSFRSAFKAINRCGLPGEELWPYAGDVYGREPSVSAFGMAHRFRGLRYVRLGSVDGNSTLQELRTFLAAGFTFVLGFPVCSGIADDAWIPFPTSIDTVMGGHAVSVVGYNDRLRIRSNRGALLFRNCWGPHWGDQGFGWLPYQYVTQGLATDFWTLLKPAWIRSGEFSSPL
jgi:C1A family cysteine protease